MRELCLHLVDIAENSAAADSSTITITIVEDLDADRLLLRVRDDGRGMDAETAARVLDPFSTSRTTRKVGLGIPLLLEAAESSAGGLKLESLPGVGTTVEAWFQHSHIDRMPLGDVPGTFLTLLVAHPEIHWIFEYTYRASGQPAVPFIFDDQPVKEILGDLPMTDPDILAYLRATLNEGCAPAILSL